MKYIKVGLEWKHQNIKNDKNDKEYEYTYQTEISFSINKICQDGNYNNNIVDNESRWKL